MQDFITKDDLLTLNVDLDDKDFDELLAALNDKVADLIGEEIFDALTPEDGDKLVAMQETASDQEIGQWIAERVPDYTEIIENNIDIVLNDFIDGEFDQK